MKRIEFIAPVEAMRGNLSGAQKLEYPTDNQGAYEGPVGSVNYARNYSPRFVGAKIARNGRKYFTVRTKTANHLTAKAKKAMAIMGGTGAIIGSILRDKTATIYTNLYGAWAKAQELGDSRTFRTWLNSHVRQMLIDKQVTHHVQVASFGQDIDNPWMKSGNLNVTVSNAILWKFATELGPNGLTFVKINVNGDEYEVATINGQTFESLYGVNGSLYGTLFGSMAKVSGNFVAFGWRLGATDQVKCAVGSDLNGAPLWYIDEGEEHAVAPADEVDTSLIYTAHAAA